MSGRLGRVLGLSEDEAAILARRAREDLGWPRYLIRATSFFVATTPPGRLLPLSLKRRAIGSLVGRMLDSAADAMGYLGLAPLPRSGRAGRGLLPGSPGPEDSE